MNIAIVEKLIVIEYTSGSGFNAKTVFTRNSGVMSYWHSEHPYNRAEMQARVNRYAAEGVKIEQHMVYSDAFDFV